MERVTSLIWSKVSTNKSSHEYTHPCPIVLSKCSFTLNIPCPSPLFFFLKVIQVNKTCLLESQQISVYRKVRYYLLLFLVWNKDLEKWWFEVLSLMKLMSFMKIDHQTYCGRMGSFLCHQCLHKAYLCLLQSCKVRCSIKHHRSPSLQRMLKIVLLVEVLLCKIYSNINDGLCMSKKGL